jgi:serine/threonine-protein kinase
VRFWYRQAPVLLERWLFLSSYLIGTVWPGDPGLRFSGEALVVLDRHGRLLELTVTPPEHVPPDSTTRDTDWTALFRAAGLDPAMWTPAEPEWMPQFHSDRQLAWVPRDGPAGGARVEAASFRGRPVSFLRIFPWTSATRDAGTVRTGAQRVGDFVRVLILAAVMLGAALAARRNLKLDRADRKGALRVGVAIGVLTWLTWLLSEHHVPSIWEMYLVIVGTAWALFAGSLVAVFYLALEPHVRRTWPEIIVSWSRMIAGDWRDPLVARDVLIGVAAATIVGSFDVFGQFVASAVTGTVPLIENSPRVWFGTRPMVAQVVAVTFWSAFLGLMYLLVFFAVRRLLRHEWAAVLAGALLLGLAVSSTIGSTTLAERLPFALLAQAGLFILLSRVGLVALISAMFVIGILEDFPVTWPLTPWYSSIGLVGLAVTMALAVAAFRIVRSATAVARR